MPVKLRIPDRYAASLAELARLSPKELADFLKAARDEEPTLAFSQLTNAIASRLSMDRTRVNDIAGLLAGLQGAREGFGLSVAEFVSELREAIEISGKDELRPPDWTAFQDAITAALSGEDALAISSRALDVMQEHSHVYCSGRVLTDLRPVFKSDVEQEPAAFVVIHTLKLTYHEEGEHREFFVAMDKQDVESLISVLDRGLKKEGSLKAARHFRILEVKS